MRYVLSVFLIAAVLFTIGCAENDQSTGTEIIEIGEVSLEDLNGYPYLVLLTEKIYPTGGYRIDVSVEYDDQAKEMIVTPKEIIAPPEEQPHAKTESPARTHVRIDHEDYKIVVRSGSSVFKYMIVGGQLTSVG